MVLLIVIFTYLFIGLAIERKNSDVVDDLIEESCHESSRTAKGIVATVSILGIMLIAPIVELIFGVMKTYHYIRFKIAISRVRRHMKKAKKRGWRQE